MQDLELRRLPLGVSTFSSLRAFNQIYVDKTDLIYRLACCRDKIFLARPRRFGKSLLTSTFESLFKYGLRDFKGLAIEKLWDDKTYAVAHLDFSEFKEFKGVAQFQEKFFKHLSRKLKKVGFEVNPNDADVLGQISDWLESLPGSSLVCLIDEYDAPLTACLHDVTLFEEVQAILSEFFSILKSQEGCLRFVFLTGITKFSSTGIFSGLNNFTDISMNTDYGALLGLTEDEIKTNFGEYLKNASKVLNLPLETVLDKLRENYDGFCFDNKALNHVYCPWSVLNFLKDPGNGFENYWYASAGQPTVLSNYLKNHELENPSTYAEDKFVDLDVLNASRDYDKIDLTVLLTQAGYLTIKEVDADRIVRLGYPNQEVAVSMARLYADKLLAHKLLRRPGEPLVSDVLAKGTLQEVIQTFNNAVQAIDYQNYPIQDEASCRAYIQVLLIGAALIPHVEVHNALGRSDMEISIGELHWVFEFKFVSDEGQVPQKLQEAIEQIQSRNYGLSQPNRPLRRVALVFNGKERKFSAYQEV